MEGNDESGAISALESVLRPIDRYAIAYRQTIEPIWNNEATDAWRKEVLHEASNREWEIEQIELKRLQEEKQLETSTEYVRAAPSRRGYGRSKKLFLNFRESRVLEEKQRRVSGGEWTLHFDEKLKRNYYFNSRTGKCTWTKPLVLAVSDALCIARELRFGGFPPALLRLILTYSGSKDRFHASMTCLHWYTVAKHRSLWLRVVPNHQLRAASAKGRVFSQQNCGETIGFLNMAWGIQVLACLERTILKEHLYCHNQREGFLTLSLKLLLMLLTEILLR